MKPFSRVLTAIFFTGLVGITSAGTASAATLAPTAPVVMAIPPSCNPNDNLTLTADQFLAKCVRGSVRREFPSQLLNVTVDYLQNNRNLSPDHSKAWKFISQTRFRK